MLTRITTLSPFSFYQTWQQQSEIHRKERKHVDWSVFRPDRWSHRDLSLVAPPPPHLSVYVLELGHIFHWWTTTQLNLFNMWGTTSISQQYQTEERFKTLKKNHIGGWGLVSEVGADVLKWSCLSNNYNVPRGRMIKLLSLPICSFWREQQWRR